MERSQKIIDAHFAVQGGVLVVGGVPVSRLAEEFGTPSYLYDFDVLGRVYGELRRRLPERVEIYYAMKANPSFAITNWFSRAGVGVELASIGELVVARAAGFEGGRMIFAGPGKSVEELEAAVAEPIRSINVESLQELADIADIARRRGTVATVSLRINPAKDVSGSQMKMGGGPSQFGIDEERVGDALEALKACGDALRLVGIHVYVGSQILDHALALQNAERSIAIARRVADAIGRPLELINLGGGLGTAYYASSRELDDDKFCEGLTRILADLDGDAAFEGSRFILELGRHLVAQCGIFLCRVRYTKESRGARFAVLDGGMNDCSVATGNLGQAIRRPFPLCVANRVGAPLDEKFEYVGPLCTPLDSFGGPFLSPAVVRDDLIAVFLVGAYGFSTSPHGFLSHPGCAEVAVAAGRAQMIRRPREVTTFLDGQQLFVP